MECRGKAAAGSKVVRVWPPGILLVATALLAAGSAAARAADPPVDLEIATEPGLMFTQAREWSEMLNKAGFSSVRMRGGKGGDMLTIETRGSETAPSYFVTGALTADGQLMLLKGR